MSVRFTVINSSAQRYARANRDAVHNCTAVSWRFRHNTRMKIGIIGSGKMGTGLGRLWAKRGHHVMFSYSRKAGKLENLVLEIGSHARSGTPRDAVGFADVLFLAVPWGEVKNALTAAGGMNGKTLVSCVNPVGP